MAAHTHTQADWRYWFDFIFFPAIAVAAIAYDARSIGWFGLAALGVLAGTFAEYFVHRFVLHRLMWHSNHERHHTHPHEFVVFPIWMLPTFFAGVFLLAPLAFFTGFVIWYIWFLSMHHALHHWDLSNWPLLRRHHDWHDLHHQGVPANYGITHQGFDWLFGTYKAV